MTKTLERQDAAGLLLGGWYTTEELAEIIGVDPSTLRRWRTAEPVQGPPFVRLSGAVTRYSAMDVQRWLLSRRIDPQERAR
ncbi:helix-turn-helix domain-containing protein [Actinomadura madurae]|uniref:helix-turn-helix transcriptional regulator n=1 Tax=Actinomadura madurae TaxID=1993 RepID=UPI00399A9CBD